MNWIEATINTSPEEIDSLVEALVQMGIQGVSIEDEQDLKRFLEENKAYWDYIDESLQQRFQGVSCVKFYVINDADGKKALDGIEERLQKEVQRKTIRDENWEYTWREHYKPIEIGEHLVIVPEWERRIPENKTILRMNPGLAFGTGSHATTRMCLKLLEQMDLKEKKLLDAGFGSGILGLAALKMGCASVAGCDIDPNAVIAARENAALNAIDGGRLQVHVGNILTDQRLQRKLGTNYDIVVANIVADVILRLSDIVKNFMGQEAVFICSGIISNRSEEVEAALERNGLAISRHLQEEEWNCYQCTLEPV